MREGLAEFVPHVYRLALRLTGDGHRAEDLTQETFLRAWKRRDQLKEGRALRVWLFKIAANLWTDELRRSHSPAAPLSLPEVKAVSDTATPDRRAEAKENLEQAVRRDGRTASDFLVTCVSVENPSFRALGSTRAA